MSHIENTQNTMEEEEDRQEKKSLVFKVEIHIIDIRLSKKFFNKEVWNFDFHINYFHINMRCPFRFKLQVGFLLALQVAKFAHCLSLYSLNFPPHFRFRENLLNSKREERREREKREKGRENRVHFFLFEIKTQRVVPSLEK